MQSSLLNFQYFVENFVRIKRVHCRC